MSMDFYLPRSEQIALRNDLNTIPGLVEELSITITRQARITRPGLGHLRKQKPGSRLPFHLAAAEASTELRNCLHGWVHTVCTQRQTPYTGRRDTMTLANWLNRNLTVLALTPTSETAYSDIHALIEHCRTLIDLPPEDELHIDPARITAANRSVVTLATIDTIASRLGPMGNGLNRDRLRLLAKHGDLKPTSIDTDTGTKFYRLGDVLHAHHNGKRTKRRRA